MTISKGFVAPAPCKACPFRKDVPIYLRRPRRVEIATALLSDQTFSCHSQVDYSEENEEGETIPNPLDAQMCAGAAKSLLLADTDTNLMRVGERVGAFDSQRLLDNNIPIWDIYTWQRLTEGSTEDDADEEELEDIETCATVNEGCLAPAGYATGNGVVHGTEAADDSCTECGDPCCSNCLSDTGLCGMCAEYEDE